MHNGRISHNNKTSSNPNQTPNQTQTRNLGGGSSHAGSSQSAPEPPTPSPKEKRRAWAESRLAHEWGFINNIKDKPTRTFVKPRRDVFNAFAEFPELHEQLLEVCQAGDLVNDISQVYLTLLELQQELEKKVPPQFGKQPLPASVPGNTPKPQSSTAPNAPAQQPLKPRANPIPANPSSDPSTSDQARSEPTRPPATGTMASATPDATISAHFPWGNVTKYNEIDLLSHSDAWDARDFWNSLRGTFCVPTEAERPGGRAPWSKFVPIITEPIGRDLYWPAPGAFNLLPDEFPGICPGICTTIHCPHLDHPERCQYKHEIPQELVTFTVTKRSVSRLRWLYYKHIYDARLPGAPELLIPESCEGEYT